MAGLFESDIKVSNSPAQRTRYEGRSRRSFLIAALRTRSLFAREELARIIGPFSLSELLAVLLTNSKEPLTWRPGHHRMEVAFTSSLPRFFWRIRRVYRFGFRAIRFVLRRVWRYTRRAYRFGLRAIRFVLRRVWRYTRRAYRFGLRAIRFVLRRLHRLVRLPLRVAETFEGLMNGSLDVAETSSSIWPKLMGLKRFNIAWIAKPTIALLRPLDAGILRLIDLLTPPEASEEEPQDGVWTSSDFEDEANQVSFEAEENLEFRLADDSLDNSLPEEVMKAEVDGDGSAAETLSALADELLEDQEPDPTDAALAPARGGSTHSQRLKTALNWRRIRRHYRYSEIAILDLAWLHSNQGIHNEDLDTAWSIYQAYRDRFGLEKVTHMHLVDMALLASRLGKQQEAVFLSKRAKSTVDLFHLISPRRLSTTAALGIQHSLDRSYAYDLELSVHPQFLRQDAKNPLRGAADPIRLITERRSEIYHWLNKLSKALLPADVCPLGIVDEPAISLLDSLTAPYELRKIYDGPKVTVVMSAFQPDQSILSAARSVLESTYQNLELMVIDDCSGPEYEDLLNQVAALDSRVVLKHQEGNGGTYRIRNRAMDEATGDLMTFHDSDDWIHPQRIEKQVRRLVRSGRIANISMSTRLTHNLEAAESIRRLRIGLCEPSLLFWREQAKSKVGYFDNVRKGGDAEFRQRLERAFNQDLEVIDPFRCLTIQRADNGGLTQGDLGFRWIVDFRLTYRDSFNYFQKSTDNLFVTREEEREFYAPSPMRIPRSQITESREFDVVFAANAHDPINAKLLIESVNTSRELGKKVGFYQLNSPYPYSNPKTIRQGVLDLLNSGELESVYPSDQLRIADLVVLAPTALIASHRPIWFRWEVSSVRLADQSEQIESWTAEGEGLSKTLEQLVFQLASPSSKE